MLTSESAWWKFLSSSDSYDPDRVAADREVLRRHYLRNGYADFRVLSSVAELAPDRKSFYLTFTLEEGERYKFGKVQITSQIKEIDPTGLIPTLKIREGEWYDQDRIEDAIRRLTDVVGNLGYAFVEIRPDVKRDAEQRIIDVVFDIREGPRTFIERIDIVGNVRTLDKVVRREFRLVEGDAYNADKIRRSERRIKDLNFFKSVEVSQSPGSAPDQLILTAKVEEQSTGELLIGGGFSTSDGPLGEITIRERNLLGKAQDLKLTTIVSSRRQQFDLGFVEPYFLDRELGLYLNAYHITRDLRRFSSYKKTTSGGDAALRFQLSEVLSQKVGYTLRRDEVTDVESEASRYIRDQEGEYLSSFISNEFQLNYLDSRLDPTDGLLVTLSNDLAGLGGDAKYLRSTLKSAFYMPIADDWILSLRGEAGLILGFSEDIRITDRYFLGGDNLRGFRIGGAGPADVQTKDALGGNKYYAGTVEVQFPINFSRDLPLKGRIFTDFGSSWDVDATGPEVRDENSLRMSAGVGVSWASPFGPIRIDFGIPFLKEDYDREELFRFGFGTRF